MREVSDGKMYREHPLLTLPFIRNTGTILFNHGDCIVYKAHGANDSVCHVAMFPSTHASVCLIVSILQLKGRVVDLSVCRLTRKNVAHVVRLIKVNEVYLHDFRCDEDIVAVSDIISKFDPVHLKGAYTSDGDHIDQLPPYAFELLPPGHMQEIYDRFTECKKEHPGVL